MMNDDEKVRAEIKSRGLHFRPWEIRPDEVDDGPSPYPAHTQGGKSWPKAQRLRRELLASYNQRMEETK